MGLFHSLILVSTLISLSDVGPGSRRIGPVCYVARGGIKAHELGFSFIWFSLVLCEYLKFRIKSNSYFSIRFDSKPAQLFEISEYFPSPISFLFNRMTPIFHLSNHA